MAGGRAPFEEVRFKLTASAKDCQIRGTAPTCLGPAALVARERPDRPEKQDRQQRSERFDREDRPLTEEDFDPDQYCKCPQKART